MNEIKNNTTIKMTDISIVTILSEHNKSIARLNNDIENTQSQVVQALEVIKDTQKNGIETDRMLFDFAQATNKSLSIAHRNTIILGITTILLIFINIILLMRLHG